MGASSCPQQLQQKLWQNCRTRESVLKLCFLYFPSSHATFLDRILNPLSFLRRLEVKLPCTWQQKKAKWEPSKNSLLPAQRRTPGPIRAHALDSSPTTDFAAAPGTSQPQTCPGDKRGRTQARAVRKMDWMESRRVVYL